ncbi:MAG: hypothetical protein R3E56_20230 [Burkholderiaceae bacterium]
MAQCFQAQPVNGHAVELDAALLGGRSSRSNKLNTVVFPAPLAPTVPPFDRAAPQG